MKNRFLSSLLHVLILGGILASPLQATPYGPPDVRNLRRTQSSPDIANLPVPDENEKKCMLDAIALLIKAELEQEFIYSYDTGAFSQIVSQLNEESLPQDFALAIRTAAEKLDQMDREERASYYDYYQDPTADEIVKNWLILEAYCRRDLAISLEWESMKAMWRLQYLKDYLFDAQEDISQFSEIEKMMDQYIFPLGYQGTADPKIRKVIMDWYQKTVMTLMLPWKSNLDFPFFTPGEIEGSSLLKLPFPDISKELKKLLQEELDVYQKLQALEQSPPSTRILSKEEKNHIRSLERQLAKAKYERNRYLIDAVGISLDEYNRKIWDQLKSSVIQKEGQTPNLTKQERNRKINNIRAEWEKNGIPEQKFPGLTEMIRP